MTHKKIAQKVDDLRKACIDEDCSLIVMAGNPSIDDKNLHGTVYGSIAENNFMALKLLGLLAEQAGQSMTRAMMILTAVAAQSESDSNKNAQEILSEEFKRVYADMEDLS